MQEGCNGHEHAENPRTASYVQDDLVSEKVLVLINGALVRFGSDFILLNVADHVNKHAL